ncbi:helix-turn-helix domain-containing protein [Sessilibacter corallicola]|uniref:Helix-turn-helix domain-containing protein n=1 Tax=Sessilibacter corallicola TaxID=2904075 RepID=A0ABQ0A8N5_9GAMM|nr:helix-turn-helix domain-containing protein [Sessilibacter corallicola]MCE2030464.1 helix-turn-helix domain-containing protein [Sessilibacter corallicola]
MDISEVAKVSGVKASTLRFYEEKGLIKSTGRRGIRRQFSEKVIDQLALIALGQNAGFSLDELVEMFIENRNELNRDKLLAKAEELDSKINELVAMRDGLRHAAACNAPNHFECPTFNRLLGIAAKNRIKLSVKLNHQPQTMAPER